jgi:outer membrane lipoprotein SlyB
LNRNGWVFLAATAILLSVGTCKGENPPPQEQCKHALSACDTYVNALEGQVKQLQEEVEAYKKEVGKGQDAPITLYMALGGAASGGAVGEAWGGQSGGLKGALTGAAVGAVLGYCIRGLAR